MQHDLMDTDTTLECRVCGRTWNKEWKRGPQNDCMGLRWYRFGHFEGLMTANQLSIMGYRTGKDLPDPAGYYWREDGPVYLYNPAEALPKKAVTRPRITRGVNTLRWPVKLLYVLDRFLTAEQERAEQEQEGHICSHQTREEIEASIEEVVSVASSLAFGEYEISVTEDCIDLNFPAVRLRRRYDRQPTNWRGDADRHKAAVWIAEAYRQVQVSMKEEG